MRNIPNYSHIDYAAWGFKAGLEVHYQLATPTKLFCRCPARYRHSEPDARIVRHMRPTLSEMGEYDGTALMEKKTRKNVIYELYHDSVCTYEMDDTPPFMIDESAVDYAIEIALVLNCNLVDELHIARKQYLDGSIPTGFQRTTIIGIDGWVPLYDRRAHVIQLALEEEACRQISNVGHDVTFRTDRLSIPLIEVVTAPEARHPLDLATLGWNIAWALRATGKVRRGIGSVRQDVNVSIAGGTRVEIKGVPRIGQFPVLAHYEAIRQKALLDLKYEMERRELTPEDFPETADAVDITDLGSYINIESLHRALGKGGRIITLALPKMRGLLTWVTGPGRNFDWEISGRLKVIACLDDRPNLLIEDDYDKFGELLLFGGEGHQVLRNLAHAGEEDAVLVTWGPEEDMATAAKEIRNRCADGCRGIPSETRQYLLDGTTDFERILPGADRMYPDTDLPPQPITAERRKRVAAIMPTLPWVRLERWQKAGLHPELIRDLFNSPLEIQDLMDEILEHDGIKAAPVAHFLTAEIKALKRVGFMNDGISTIALRKLLTAFKVGSISDKGMFLGLKRFLADKDEGLQQYLAEETAGIEEDPEGWAQREVSRLREKDPTARPVRIMALAMERLMEEANGKVDGARLAEAVRVVLEE